MYVCVFALLHRKTASCLDNQQAATLYILARSCYPVRRGAVLCSPLRGCFFAVF